MTEKTEWIGEEFAPVFYRAMAAWYEGGQKGDSPTMRWCIKFMGIPSLGSVDNGLPSFEETSVYIWKPAQKRMVTINWRELVAPESVMPPEGTLVWVLGYESEVVQYFDFTAPYDIKLAHDCIRDGRIFLAQKDCKAMSDWLTQCRLGQT